MEIKKETVGLSWGQALLILLLYLVSWVMAFATGWDRHRDVGMWTEYSDCKPRTEAALPPYVGVAGTGRIRE